MEILGCVNALNGLLSFLRIGSCRNIPIYIVCQRPKRAFIISTIFGQKGQKMKENLCQRPKRAFIISTT